MINTMIEASISINAIIVRQPIFVLSRIKLQSVA